VRDGDGSDRGRLYVDPFAHDGKGGGAWMGAYAEPSPLTGEAAMVLIQLNATRPGDGRPALLTPLDVRILFHEFGHALQMLLSDVTYPRVAGINVAVDVVEFASRFFESMAIRPDVLARYARHYETGEPLSDADVAALAAAVRDEAPTHTVRGIAGDWLDQAWHGLAPGETVDDVDAFEAAVAERDGPHVPGLALNYRSTYFVHIFTGHYGGTHYGYLWSTVLEAAAAEWLDEQGGLTLAAGRRLRDELLSRGRVVDPIAAFRAITGRAPCVEPLLRRRGLAGSGDRHPPG
jgi:peptidyl-dipeptidase Dcp